MGLGRGGLLHKSGSLCAPTRISQKCLRRGEWCGPLENKSRADPPSSNHPATATATTTATTSATPLPSIASKCHCVAPTARTSLHLGFGFRPPLAQ